MKFGSMFSGGGGADLGLMAAGLSPAWAVEYDERIAGVYTDNAAHEIYSSVVAGQISTPVELTGKTFTNGLFDANDVTIPGSAGNNAEALVLYVQNAGANTTWRLVAYFDTGVTGLPVLPNGSPIDIAWNPGGIFQD